MYQELIDIGFKREEYTDNVFFKQYGYHPFLLRYKISKRSELVFHSLEECIHYRRYDKEENIIKQSVFTDSKDAVCLLECLSGTLDQREIKK